MDLGGSWCTYAKRVSSFSNNSRRLLEDGREVSKSVPTWNSWFGRSCFNDHAGFSNTMTMS